jgi:hypothetical protein
MQAHDTAPRSVRPELVAIVLLLSLSIGGLLVFAAPALGTLTDVGLFGALTGAQSDAKFSWHFVRASGTVAYLLLTTSTIWGLVLSNKVARDVHLTPFSLAMHNALSWAALAMAGLHAWLLLFDTYYVYLAVHLLVPFTGPYRPGWTGLGTLSFYLLLLISASFGWRKFIKHKIWRALHYGSFLVFVLVTLHGLKAGTDSPQVGMQVLYGGSSLVVLVLTINRLLAALRRSWAGVTSPTPPYPN